MSRPIPLITSREPCYPQETIFALRHCTTTMDVAFFLYHPMVLSWYIILASVAWVLLSCYCVIGHCYRVQVGHRHWTL